MADAANVATTNADPRTTSCSHLCNGANKRYRGRMRWVVVLLCVAACGGGVTLEQLAQAELDARCERAVGCGAFATKSECTIQWAVADDPSPPAALDKELLDYDGTKANECFA